ncbi:MAG: SOS response-associated peptidase [Nanoarchaeota archaeon]
MCGRFAITVQMSDVKKSFEITRVLNEFKPSYNVAPSQGIPVVLAGRVLDSYRWGLIPHWTKENKLGFMMINARVEGVAEKPGFRQAFLNQRCIIPATGFFEWKKEKGVKVPQYIQLRDRELYGFAGLWDRWCSPDGKDISSCAIMTTESNEFMKPIHDRMPVILEKKDEEAWLSGQGTKEHLSMLKPSTEEMKSHAVSTLVNSPKNNSPECIKAV